MRADPKLDIVIPATRRTVNHLLWTISQGTATPNRVIVVTNEVVVAESFTTLYPVDVINFSSTVYPIGHHDQALRRQIGIAESDADVVMTLDDDQFAPRNLVLSAKERMEGRRIIWGHHRYIDFEQHGEHLLDLPPDVGRSRENGVNREHLFYSSYAGLMVAERSLLEEVGGYDMAFLCRRGNEDQSLGRRISMHLGMAGKIEVLEPPFAWHPDRDRCHGETRKNTCGSPSSWLEPTTINGVKFQRCSKPSCPYRVFDDTEDRLFTDQVLIPYDPSAIRLKKERIS